MYIERAIACPNKKFKKKFLKQLVKGQYHVSETTQLTNLFVELHHPQQLYTMKNTWLWNIRDTLHQFVKFSRHHKQKSKRDGDPLWILNKWVNKYLWGLYSMSVENIIVFSTNNKLSNLRNKGKWDLYKRWLLEQGWS